MARQSDVINRKRIRKIKGSFSWIDHQFITGGFLEILSGIEILLYFFLVGVSDRNGVSFYHDDRICRLLKIDLLSLGQARDGLIQRSLLAYDYPVYQVLALPLKPIHLPTAQEMEQERRKRDLSYIQKMKKVIGM